MKFFTFPENEPSPPFIVQEKNMETLLTVEALATLKWEFFWEDILKQKISYLENFREICNPFNNAIMIFTHVKQGKTTHTLHILHDRYGESGGDKILSGNLRDVKKQAVEIVKDLIQNKDAKFFY